MDSMKKAENLGKQIKYRSGYSNLTFDLWILLHMTEYSTSCSQRKQYIVSLNRVFDEHFESMEEFKKEKNFKRCLRKIKLSNVKDAIQRAEKIMIKNKENGYILHQYRGYQYYRENPSLSSWEPIKKILSECKLI